MSTKLTRFVKFTSPLYSMFDLAPYTYYWKHNTEEPVLIRKGVFKDKDPFKDGSIWTLKILYRMEKKINGRFSINFEKSKSNHGYNHTSNVVTEITERVDELLLENSTKIRYNPSLAVHSDFESGVCKLIEDHNTKAISIRTISGSMYTRKADPEPSKKRKAEESSEEPVAKRASIETQCLLWKMYKWCTETYPKRYTKPVDDVVSKTEETNENIRDMLIKDPNTWAHYFEDSEDYFRALEHFNIIVDGKVIWREINDYKPPEAFEESRAALRRALEYLRDPASDGDYHYYKDKETIDKKVKEHCPASDNTGPAGDFTKTPNDFLNYFQKDEDLYRALEAMNEEDLNHKRVFKEYDDWLDFKGCNRENTPILHSNIEARRHNYNYLKTESYKQD